MKSIIKTKCCSAISRKKFKMNPKDNSLVLFPSWVPHEVEENKSDRQRINIAFNVTIG